MILSQYLACYTPNLSQYSSLEVHTFRFLMQYLDGDGTGKISMGLDRGSTKTDLDKMYFVYIV